MTSVRSMCLFTLVVLIQLEAYRTATTADPTTTPGQETTTEDISTTEQDGTTLTPEQDTTETFNVTTTEQETTQQTAEEANTDNTTTIIIIVTVCIAVLVATIIVLVIVIIRLRRQAKAGGVERTITTRVDLYENKYETPGNFGQGRTKSNTYETIALSDPYANTNEMEYDTLEQTEYENSETIAGRGKPKDDGHDYFNT